MKRNVFTFIGSIILLFGFGAQSVSAATTNTTIGTSRNWSGYAATGSIYTGVAGTWKIPSVIPSSHTGADATWIGVGGVRKSDLIQAGTMNIVTGDGTVQASAFFELLPAISTPIPVDVAIGDTITASITLDATDHWRISFQDNTNGKSFETEASYHSSLSSAEWIQEAPSNGNREIPLDNFSSVQFTNATAIENLQVTTVSKTNSVPITMINTANQTLASPSELTADGSGFTVSRAATTVNPVAQLDNNLEGLRRYGVGVGHYAHYTPLPHALWPTSTAPSITPPPDIYPKIWRQRFRIVP